jgi:undecaprenyl diphosphate synthase
VETKTAHNTKLTATFAINYGGHDELTRAARTLAEQVAAGQLKPHEITEKTVENALDTSSLPPVDLLIRTSGEQRTSNFLPWQAAYAELYFTETAWPDFEASHLHTALAAFAARSRRFGAAPATTAA